MDNIELKVVRFKFSPKSTIGMLYLNGTLFGFTLEDVVRNLQDKNKDGDFDDAGEGKIYGKTAIPAGSYDVKLTMSNRFKKVLPEVLNVPGYKGIRIHAGNTQADTLGCILVGTGHREDMITESRVAMDRLMTELVKAKTIKLIIR